MELADLQAALGNGYPGFRARQIYDAVYRQRVTQLDEISALPKAIRSELAERLPVGLLRISKFFDGQDGTRRYLMKMSDGKTVEAVWMPEETRSTVCISSQAGCAVDCKFCLTALLGLEPLRSSSLPELLCAP